MLNMDTLLQKCKRSIQTNFNISDLDLSSDDLKPSLSSTHLSSNGNINALHNIMKEESQRNI